MYNRVNIKEFWSGRIDELDGEQGARWHQKVVPIDLNEHRLGLTKKDICLLGYETNQGVERNKGRSGARKGPEAIRKALANMAWHDSNDTMLYDGGNISDKGTCLEKAQEEFTFFVSKIGTTGARLVAFGGGHDIAYAHFSGIQQANPNKRIGIINFDAHFDLRKNECGASSGTPFYQIYQDCKKSGDKFQYLCLGIQEQSNTGALFQMARESGTQFITADKVSLYFLEMLQQTISGFVQNVDIIYLTICLDVFSAAFAPGVSAGNPLGIQPDVVLVLINFLKSIGKPLSFDIAELNPTFDIDNRTAKLAASLIYHYLKD